MSNVRKLNYKKIYIFDQANKDVGIHNNLKEFLYYLKYKGESGIIDFTYSCEEDSLHKSLTIKDNFILDSIPTSLIRDGENNLNEFLKTLKNPHLVELISLLGNLNNVVKELTPENLKLSSLVKAFLSQSEYVFLVEPEAYQEISTIKTLKKCIEYEVDNNYRKIFIKPKNKDIWLDISTHIISKCDKTFNYLDYPNPLYKTKTNNEFRSTYNFTLASKKVG